MEGVGIKEKYKRMLMKQKTNDRNFLFLDIDKSKSSQKSISGASTTTQTAPHDSKGKKRLLANGYQEDDEDEEFNSDYILETDYGFMERGDTLVTSKKMGRSTALNKHDEEYEEYGEEEEEAV